MVKSKTNKLFVMGGVFACVTAFILIFSFVCHVETADGRVRKRSERKKRKKKVKYVKSKHGVSALMKMANSQKDMIKVLKQENKSYKNLLGAIEDGDLKKGDSMDQVEKEIGLPVVALIDEEAGIEEWVYKPSSSSFFDKEKIYLVFSSSDQLIGWKLEDGTIYAEE